MRESMDCDTDTRVVVDDSTIYEIDLRCLRCMSEWERGERLRDGEMACGGDNQSDKLPIR